MCCCQLSNFPQRLFIMRWQGALLKWLWDIYCCLWHPGKKNIFHFTRYNSLIQTKKFSLFNYNNFLHSVQDVPISPNSFFYYEYFCFYHLSPCSITASMKTIISSVLLKQFSNKLLVRYAAHIYLIRHIY